MMAAKLSHCISSSPAKGNPLLLHLQTPSLSQSPNFSPFKSGAVSRKNHNNYPLPPLVAKMKDSRGPRGFITVSFPSGQWAGDWTYDFVLTLKDLRLHDLAEDGRKHTPVYITLSLHKHPGVGVSADGRIITSIARKCKNCSSYCCEIDTTFNVWVLPSSRDDSSNQLPELGGHDPSVIYVKTGDDAVLDSLIQETVRLQILVKEACSDACEKADTKLHYIGVQETASLDRRWSKLRDYRNTHLSLTERDELVHRRKICEALFIFTRALAINFTESGFPKFGS